MVAANVRCIVVEVPLTSRPRRGDRSAAVPRDLLPWADPYIASLVAKVKAEILAERRRQICCEAPPPLFRGDLEYERPLREDWFWDDER